MTAFFFTWLSGVLISVGVMAFIWRRDRKRDAHDILRLVRIIKEREAYINELTERIAALEDERMK